MSRVITVTGEISTRDLGRVLIHEHVFSALAGADLDSRLELERATVVDEAVRWLEGVKEHGVTAVVDATPITWYRRPDILQEASERSGVHVIASTGMYTERMGWPFHLKLLKADQLAELFVREIEEGMLHSGVRAGIIKIATGQASVSKYEGKAIEAAVVAQHATGVGIITHTEGADGAFAQLDAFEQYGADLDRILIGHLDNSVESEYHLRLVERGANLGFDRIGHSIITPDEDRFGAIRAVVDAGHADRVLLSHDAVATYLGDFFVTPEIARWKEYGFTFLFREVLPRLRSAGVSEVTIDQMMVDNPRRVLAP